MFSMIAPKSDHQYRRAQKRDQSVIQPIGSIQYCHSLRFPIGSLIHSNWKQSSVLILNGGNHS